MVTYIKEMTPEQRAQIPAHLEKWDKIADSTEPADWATWEEGARACYGFVNEQWPGFVVRTPSILSGALVAGFLAYMSETKVDLKTALANGSTIKGWGTGTGDVMFLVIPPGMDAEVPEGVEVRASGTVFSDSTATMDRAHSYRVPGSKIRETWPTYLGGHWWIAWQTFTSFYRDVMELELPGDAWERDEMFTKAQTAAGWWWPHDKFVVVSDRPRVLSTERDGEFSVRLHSATGPAVQWSEGPAIYAWHGTQVPAQVIEGTMSVEDILREPNTEIRRCAIEVRGWDWFVREAKLEILDQADDPGNPGQVLNLYTVPDRIFEEPVMLLICTNATVERDGTRRVYGIMVPDEINKAVDAAAWSFGVPVEVYTSLEWAS